MALDPHDWRPAITLQPTGAAERSEKPPGEPRRAVGGAASWETSRWQKPSAWETRSSAWKMPCDWLVTTRRRCNGCRCIALRPDHGCSRCWSNTTTTSNPTPCPHRKAFAGQLRPYQEAGLGWLAFLYRFGQGACLADDMGLGKTIQLLAFLQYLKVQKELKRPVLLVCPTSVMTNWRREGPALHPWLRVIEHYGSRRPATQGTGHCTQWRGLGSHQLRPTPARPGHPQQLRLARGGAGRGPGHQELHLQAVCRCTGAGAPWPATLLLHCPHWHTVENRVSEIWPLMNFLNPRVLGQEGFFRQRYRLPIEPLWGYVVLAGPAAPCWPLHPPPPQDG